MKHIFPWLLVLLSACTTQDPTGDELVNDAIKVYGADYTGKKVTFDFRERTYSVWKNATQYVYTRTWQDDSLGRVRDVLRNSVHLTRIIEGDTVQVPGAWADKYTNSVNSVLYFFQIPAVLNDPGAVKEYMGKVEIKGEPYYAVQVTFKKEGGGEDYQDIFMYWIHQKNKTIDYMAYSYLTEGGGVRFREAINRRKIDGLMVQDYINYKAEKGTLLESLPEMFESNQLEELSRIINEDVTVEMLD